jgi:hypothetical protein
MHIWIIKEKWRKKKKNSLRKKKKRKFIFEEGLADTNVEDRYGFLK